MTLSFYNTATRKKEPFHTFKNGEVGMYVCGVTVYDFCHIGHARSAIVFDVLARYLRAKGFHLNFIRNFTDVDDKIIQKAVAQKKDPAVIAEKYIEAYYEDMGKLGVLKADIEPRATEHIDGMIETIHILLDKGLAYVADDEVFFSVRDFEQYGILSGRKLEDMQAGSRVAIDEKKRHPMDFILWKAAKPGEPQWESPWGYGRPGWHLECSVMSNRFLGPSFEIHGGGKDLLFPHHENERAQSIGAYGGHFAQYWIHNGFVTIDSEKMSKSLGNFLTIRDALKTWHPEIIRLFLLSKHYRSPLNFTHDAVDAVQSGLIRIYRCLQKIEDIIGPLKEETEIHTVSLLDKSESTFIQKFVKMMDDDLNTAGAIGLIYEKVKEVNKIFDASSGENIDKQKSHLRSVQSEILSAGRILGILQTDPAAFFAKLAEAKKKIDSEDVEKLINQRRSARVEKDWKRADEIRDRLKKLGVVLEDGPHGTTWRFDV